MLPRFSQPDYVNVLISDAHWAWPQAVEEIFQPCGVNALVAQTPADAVRLVDSSKIHLALLDSGQADRAGIQTLRMIRKHDQLLPCILLTTQMDQHMLREALNLRVFSVVAKPVDIALLAEQIDRLFLKYYNSNLFSRSGRAAVPPEPGAKTRITKTVIKWRIHKQERSNDTDEN